MRNQPKSSSHVPVTSLVSFLFVSIFLPSHFTEARTSFYYRHLHQELRGISYDGDAFRDDEGFISLNKRKVGGYSVGRAYYSNPIRLWDGSTGVVTDFSTTFTFWVSSPAGKETEISGGMAFFLAADASIPRRSSGSYLGLVSSSSSHNARENRRFVAVEFDSLAGGTSLDTGESSCHVGINVNSMKSVARTDMNGTIFRSGPKGNARVRYDALTRNLSVTLAFGQSSSQLSHVVDLKKSLPEWVYVGFSASTGPTSDLKKISTWNFISTFDGSKQGTTINVARILWIVIPISVSVLVVIVGIYIYLRKKSEPVTPPPVAAPPRQSEVALPPDQPEVPDKVREAPRSIPLEQLTEATGIFKEEQKLGYGASGEFYRGFLKDFNREVAIKRINRDSFRCEEEFLAQVKIISKLKHKNLVEVIGWCSQGNSERLLVYEFMSNRSLYFHLFRADVLLSWERRYEIAKDVASAIHYLHEDCRNYVVHRDIKCSNIMLDQNFMAKLGDFGLARTSPWTPHGPSTQSPLMAKTSPYTAPEKIQTGKSSKETDVYSFGIVALEIACGRKALEPNEKGKESLTSWLRDLQSKGDVMEAADKKIRATDSEMKQLLVVGIWCTTPEANQRPSIKEVINALNFETKFLHNLPRIGTRAPSNEPCS